MRSDLSIQHRAMAITLLHLLISMLVVTPAFTQAQLAPATPKSNPDTATPPGETPLHHSSTSDRSVGQSMKLPEELDVELQTIQTDSDPPHDAILIRGAQKDVDAAVKYLRSMENQSSDPNLLDSQLLNDGSSGGQSVPTSPPHIQQLESRLTEATIRLNSLDKMYSSGHPLVQQASAERAAVKQQLLEARASWNASKDELTQLPEEPGISLENLRLQHQEAERAAQLIASRMRTAKQNSPNAPELETLEAQLRRAVRLALEQRVKTQELQLTQAENRLKIARSNLAQRKRNIDSIVNQRVSQLRDMGRSQPQVPTEPKRSPTTGERKPLNDSYRYYYYGTPAGDEKQTNLTFPGPVQRLNQLFAAGLSLGVDDRGIHSRSEPSFLLQYAIGEFLSSSQLNPQQRKVPLTNTSQVESFLHMLPLCMSDEIEFVMSNGIRQIRHRSAFPMIPAQSAEDLDVLQRSLRSIESDHEKTLAKIDQGEDSYADRYGSTAKAEQSRNLITAYQRQLADLRMEAITLTAQADRLRSLNASKEARLIQEYREQHEKDPSRKTERSEQKKLIDAQQVLFERIKVVLGDDYRDQMELAEATNINDEKRAMLGSRMEAIDRSLADSVAYLKMENELRDSLRVLYDQAEQQKQRKQLLTRKLEQSPLSETWRTATEDATFSDR